MVSGEFFINHSNLLAWPLYAEELQVALCCLNRTYSLALTRFTRTFDYVLSWSPL